MDDKIAYWDPAVQRERALKEFNEDDHPRDDHGRFSSDGGGSGGEEMNALMDAHSEMEEAGDQSLSSKEAVGHAKEALGHLDRAEAASGQPGKYSDTRTSLNEYIKQGAPILDRHDDPAEHPLVQAMGSLEEDAPGSGSWEDKTRVAVS